MNSHAIRSSGRRGATVALAMISLTMLLGFAALAIDIGYAYSVQAELQRNADSAALAGASALVSDNLLENEPVDPTPEIIARAQSYALGNPSGGVLIDVATDDVAPGFLADIYNPNEPIAPAPFAMFNAVEVKVRRDATLNGEIAAFFARIFGVSSIPLSATAAAVVEDGFSGYHPPPVGQQGPLLPFTVHKDKYEESLASGPDSWGWNTAAQQITGGADGIKEIWIYPNGPDVGNFGTLNVGLIQQGTDQLGGQVENGLNEGDLIAEVGTDNMVFYDDAGNPQTYTITGNPGISGGLIDNIEARLGDVVGFFLHDQTTAEGANYEYQIVDIRFGRLMEVKLNGNPSIRRVVIQPAVYNGPGIQTDPNAPGSDGMIVALRLNR